METYKSCSPMNNYRNMNQRSNYGRPMNNMHSNCGRPMGRPSNNDNSDCKHTHSHNHNSDCNHSHSHDHSSDCNHSHSHDHSSDCNHNHNYISDCKDHSNVINTITSIINGSDDCKDNNPRLSGMPLANAFVPTQPWCKLYDKKEAICQGTAFPNLNLIFCGSRGRM